MNCPYQSNLLPTSHVKSVGNGVGLLTPLSNSWLSVRVASAFAEAVGVASRNEKTNGARTLNVEHLTRLLTPTKGYQIDAKARDR
jgi:hypothetical protein